MEGSSGKGYAWAISAGFNAALAAVAAKLLLPPVIRYGLVVFFNVIMWGCYVNSLKALSSLQATVTNFATNFLTSGLAGFFLFEELLSFKWFAGAMFIVIGVLILSKSSVEKRERRIRVAINGCCISAIITFGFFWHVFPTTKEMFSVLALSESVGFAIFILLFCACMCI
ncbi:uncharacterized protein LOC105786819 [Gossypium raimondii]|uniref:uncharacterized protein LOC105786819 n=1 Tax=Gossypium raimondii TaxID=29730 RepID=UPI00227C8A92|nr:uncharacterized protein LOC105786819 [Gossypium raimondii]